MWVIPGSHKNGLYVRFGMKGYTPHYEILKKPDYKDQDFVPIEMKKGDLMVLDGKLVHKTNTNATKKTRYAYTWHTIDKSSKWAEDNWLSYD